MWYDILIQGTYYIAFIVGLISGFMMVFRNLRKVNIIESEKFSVEDWITCIAFSVIFALTITFIVNLTYEVFSPIDIPSIAGYILFIMLGILIIYPLWEVIFLGRPTSDAVHDFHRFLETKILDKFKGNVAYVISACIFLVLYIIPVLIIMKLTGQAFLDIAFVWFMMFPLFFLAYYAAIGQSSSIITSIYSKNIKKDYFPKSTSTFSIIFKKLLFPIQVLIVFIPFFIAIYNVYGPINTVIHGGGFEAKSNIIIAILALFNSIVFGIKGFFTKFWNRKSKTKSLDFLFGAYIFLAIGINILISFITIDLTIASTMGKSILESVLSVQIFGYQPLVVLKPLMSNYSFLMPLMIIQSLIIILYDIKFLINTNSELYADMRLAATNNAFGLTIEELIDRRKRQQRFKRGKFKIPVLIKSILLPPVYNKYGYDYNHVVRFKASNFLYVIAVENKDLAEQITQILLKNVIEKNTKGKRKQSYISKIAVDWLGFIGKKYPEFVFKPLMEGYHKGNRILQQFILDAIGDIGESLENINMVLEDVIPLLLNDDFTIRTAAMASISEMVLEGDFENEEFIIPILSRTYDILNKYYKTGRYMETALQLLHNFCLKVPDKIDIQKIMPFLNYNETKNPIIKGFIEEYAIRIIGITVYYNLDKFPKQEIIKYTNDSRNYIRYVAIDALGNYILKKPDDPDAKQIVQILLEKSLKDEDPDVNEMSVESIAEFLIMNPRFQAEKLGNEEYILNYYLDALENENRTIKENASEALKSIASFAKKDLWPIFKQKILGGNKEVARDIIHALALMDAEFHKNVELEVIYKMLQEKEANTRAEAIFALSKIAETREDIDYKKIINHLDDPDPQVRLESILTLGKIGKKKPKEIVPILISKFYNLDRQSILNVTETELYAESLGVIGEVFPSNEIIITLQQALMGDTNKLAKDVVAKALWQIGNGMIKTGKAIRTIESEEFYNQISWLSNAKKEYTIGNLIIIFIEALQQKRIPPEVMDIISDAMQDLLPVFVFIKDQRNPNQILNIMKELLAQAYYSNYEDEILEIIDRIDSLISFKRYFEVSDPLLKEDAEFYAKQYTPDGKQFHDQGLTFMLLEKQGKEYLDYALKSFEIAVDLSPHEYFTPDCYFQQGIIYLKKGEKQKAREMFLQAKEIYTSIDEIEKMKLCEKYLSSL
ncbi:MAG: hypothetical protein ACTSRZ_11865 [Promethearchaeota archaeon]